MIEILFICFIVTDVLNTFNHFNSSGVVLLVLFALGVVDISVAFSVFQYKSLNMF